MSPVDPATAWAWWALQFTPLVARVEEALVMEVSSSERLFGGQAALMAQFFRSNGAPSRVKHAWGATSLVAIGRLRCDAGQALPVNPVLPGQPASACPVGRARALAHVVSVGFAHMGSSACRDAVGWCVDSAAVWWTRAGLCVWPARGGVSLVRPCHVFDNL